MDQFERLKGRASVLGNHNLKYLRTIEKVQDRLTRRLEIRGVRDKIHLYRAAPNPGGEMDAIVSVSNDEHDALEFLGCYYAFRFLAMSLSALDELHLELLSGGDRIPIYRQFMKQAGTDFRALTTQYMLRLMDLFVAGGEVPEFVLLGTGEQHYHDFFIELSSRYPEQAGIFLTFNASLSRRIYAGSDLFLMPSRFEPCGLGQMIAMRYGSVPVVRAVGGLADTVSDYDPTSGEGTGFVFETYNAMALYTTLVRAVETYRHRDIWRGLQIRCMQQDFSWETSARKYVELYERASAFRSQDRNEQ